MSFTGTVRRRPADTADVCAREGCGKSMAGRVKTAKYCSGPCREGARGPRVKEQRGSISVTADAYAKLTALAEERGVSVSALVEEMIGKVTLC